MKPPPAPVTIGETLVEKYRVDRVIGAGGMGVVVLATHIALDQKVAIKFLLPEHASDADTVIRFTREAQALAKITSDHVARVFDVGTLESGASYMVMEYLDGQDLAAVLRERGAVASAVAVPWILEATEAVVEAHAAGIVHRDLKPANLFLAQRKNRGPIVKVLDFGISKSMGTSDALALTKTATVLGSPLYMAPEQLRGSREVDARTDIWALGVILYELLTGKPPFFADSIGALVGAIQGDAPVPPHDVNRNVPEGLSAIVLRCLEKQPSSRWSTASELAAALAPFAPFATAHPSSLPPPISDLASSVASTELAPNSGAPLAESAPRDVAWGATTPALGKSRTHLVLGVGFIGVAAIIATVIALRQDRSQSTAPLPPSANASTSAFAPTAETQAQPDAGVSPAASASSAPSVEPSRPLPVPPPTSRPQRTSPSASASPALLAPPVVDAGAPVAPDDPRPPRVRIK